VRLKWERYTKEHVGQDAATGEHRYGQLGARRPTSLRPRPQYRRLDRGIQALVAPASPAAEPIEALSALAKVAVFLLIPLGSWCDYLPFSWRAVTGRASSAWAMPPLKAECIPPAATVCRRQPPGTSSAPVGVHSAPALLRPCHGPLRPEPVPPAAQYKHKTCRSTCHFHMYLSGGFGPSCNTQR
jgi:hypothetical protein